MTEPGDLAEGTPADNHGDAPIRPTATYASVPPLSPVEAATRKLNGLLFGGGLLYVLGAAVFLGCWLARSSAMRDDTDPGALSFFILLGALAASVGTALLLVGLIGWGVKLGREAADI